MDVFTHLFADDPSHREMVERLYADNKLVKNVSELPGADEA